MVVAGFEIDKQRIIEIVREYREESKDMDPLKAAATVGARYSLSPKEILHLALTGARQKICANGAHK
jgi:hypothetical protein